MPLTGATAFAGRCVVGVWLVGGRVVDDDAPPITVSAPEALGFELPLVTTMAAPAAPASNTIKTPAATSGLTVRGPTDHNLDERGFRFWARARRAVIRRPV
jgi:hypothetical protein